MRKYMKDEFMKRTVDMADKQIFVQIRRDANDTVVPNLEFSAEDLELKLDWMGMFSEWFKEEKEHRRRFRQVVKWNLINGRIFN